MGQFGNQHEVTAGPGPRRLAARGLAVAAVAGLAVSLFARGASNQGQLADGGTPGKICVPATVAPPLPVIPAGGGRL
jgi:hypothetical protein